MMFKKRRIRNRTIKWLQAKGCHVATCLQYEFGDPDIIVCINGKYMAIKFSRNNKRVHISHYPWIKSVAKAGGEVSFVSPDNFDMFKMRVRLMLQKSFVEKYGVI